MDFHEYQKKAIRTANRELTENDQLINSALGVSGEAGELSGYVKKWAFQGHDFPKKEIIEEMGDVLWYIANMCDSMGIDLEDIAQYNIDKLMIRYPERFSPNNSVQRIDQEWDRK